MTDSTGLPATEINYDKALRGEAIAVTDSRLKEMQKQAIDGYSETPYHTDFHWHWAAVVNELIAARSSIAALRAELRQAKQAYATCMTDAHTTIEDEREQKDLLQSQVDSLRRDASFVINEWENWSSRELFDVAISQLRDAIDAALKEPHA